MHSKIGFLSDRGGGGGGGGGSSSSSSNSNSSTYSVRVASQFKINNLIHK